MSAAVPEAKLVLPEIPEETLTTRENEETCDTNYPKMGLAPSMSLGLSEGASVSEIFHSDLLPRGSRMIEDHSMVISHSTHLSKPVVRFETTLGVTLFQIKEVFERVSKKRGFETVDDEGDSITVVNKKATTFKDIIFSCVPSRPYQKMTAVRLQSKTNKITCVRRITLKALIGDMKLVKALFDDFEKELGAFNSKRVNSPRLNNSSFLGDNILNQFGSRANKYAQMHDETNADIDESVISQQNLETSSVYEFRKILSSDQYSIGKKVAEYLADFAMSYKSATESAELLPQPMESVYSLINEVVETFFADFNYGRPETKQMLPYCKQAVEKYIFGKVQSQLKPMYSAKYTDQDRLFIEKTEAIRSQQSIIAQLKFLDIPVKFWLIPKEKLDENNDLIQPLEEHELPYFDAINEFSKLSKLRTPREKLGVLLMMHSLMKSAVVDFHKGKKEVCSMDEELPIMIYIVLHSKLEDAISQLSFVEDYVNLDPSMESEKRLMTNIRVSMQYVAEEWAL